MREMSAFRRWLIELLGGTTTTCCHRWQVLIEHYPHYAWGKWECTLCKVSENFPNDEPPVPIETAICSLGDVHIVNGRKVVKSKPKTKGGERNSRRKG